MRFYNDVSQQLGIEGQVSRFTQCYCTVTTATFMKTWYFVHWILGFKLVQRNLMLHKWCASPIQIDTWCKIIEIFLAQLIAVGFLDQPAFYNCHACVMRPDIGILKPTACCLLLNCLLASQQLHAGAADACSAYAPILQFLSRSNMVLISHISQRFDFGCTSTCIMHVP